MINNIGSCGVHAADIAALRQNRARKSNSAQNGQVESATTEKPAHPAHPHGHIPPGLARAAEKIASKIFKRADADGNGSVTQEELSAVHSRHARALAASDLFKSSTPETTTETTGATDATATLPTETSTSTGVTAEQLKEALTKYFYAKVGAIYTPPTPPTPERPDPTTSTDPTTVISPQNATDPTLIAVA